MIVMGVGSMNLYVIGMNYKTAPVQIREKFSICSDEYDRVLSGIRQLDKVTECALLSTCNRTELHIFSESSQSDTGEIEACFCTMKGLELYEVKKYFYVYEGINAIRHIIKVASGMDSMILGEDQILGQFRKAYELSMKQGASKSVLNTLSRLAITSSKKIKTRNIITGKASTVAGQVGELLAGIFGKELADKSALIIGSGEVGRLVSEELLKIGTPDVFMTKRNKPGAINDDGMKVRQVDYKDRYSCIEHCDIIIGATSSPHYTITSDVLDGYMKNRDRKRIFIDLAVPRDFDESIGRFENVSMYNIDDLKTFTFHKAKGNKQFDMEYIQEQINSHAEEFIRWFQRRNVFACSGEV